MMAQEKYTKHLDILGSAQEALKLQIFADSPTLYASFKGCDHALPIVVVGKDHLVVHGDYMDEGLALHIVPGTEDDTGSCLYRVPNHLCTVIETEAEFECRTQCEDADAEMLSYAR